MHRFAFLPLLVFMCGCPHPDPGVPETNQEACVRMYNYIMGLPCADPEGVMDEEVMDELIAQICGTITDDPACDFPAVADCVIANVDCDNGDPTGMLPSVCEDLISEACFDVPGE